MHVRRISVHNLVWISVVVLALQGCHSTQTQIPSPTFDDDFGQPTTQEDITDLTVQQQEMLRQRAQVEFRLGYQIPWDFLRSSVDDKTDPAVAFGGKFNFEGFKNLYFGATIDYGNYDVATPVIAGDNQIDLIEEYDKLNFLLGFDYDIPLTEDPNSLIFRFGCGMGVAWVRPTDRIQTPRAIEDFFQIVIRPSVGLRYPLGDTNVILFTEASYEWIPERSFESTETEVIAGESPVFSSGGIWVGVAYEWD